MFVGVPWRDLGGMVCFDCSDLLWIVGIVVVAMGDHDDVFLLEGGVFVFTWWKFCEIRMRLGLC